MLPESREHKANRNFIDKVITQAKKQVTEEPRVKGRAASWELNPHTGAPGFLVGELSPRMGGSPSEIAWASLTNFAESLGLTPDASNVVETEHFEWAGHDHVRFQQTLEGIPVFGAEAIVGVSPAKQTRLIASDLEPEVAPPEVKKAIPRREAIQAALTDLGKDIRLRGGIASDVVVFPSLDGWVKCYQLLVPTTDPLGDWRYFIDVRNGNVVDSSNAMCFYHAARGQVYAQNPADTPKMTAMLRRLKYPYTSLNGAFAKVENEDAPEAVSAPGYRFYYPDGDTHFDEVNCYYGVDYVHHRFKDIGFRGLTLNNVWGKAHGGQCRANVHTGVNYNNAFYSPATGEIYFGDGSASSGGGGLNDLAKESDVVYHEFTHAVLDELRPGITGTDGAALHEGYADYFACSFTNPPEPELGEWVVPGSGVIRTLENTNKYPGPTEPHARGLAWGGGCWSLRKKLGGEVADYLIFGSMLYMTTTAPTFKYAKDRILLVDQAFCGSEYKPAVKQIFEVERGIPV